VNDSAPTRENVALVRRFEDCVGRADFPGALECITPDFELDWSNSIGPSIGVYQGEDGLRRFWQELHEVWDHFTPHAEEFLDCPPDRLITVDVVRGRGKGSGIDMEAHGAILWTIRDAKIAGMKMFQGKEAALEAAGLPA
jgi:ketosteroid isomerase-like protein